MIAAIITTIIVFFKFFNPKIPKEDRPKPTIKDIIILVGVFIGIFCLIKFIWIPHLL